MTAMKKELEEFYFNYLSNLIENKKYYEYIDKESIDSPLFINTDVEKGNYFNSDLKILYVGKENNGWFGKKEREFCALKHSVIPEKSVRIYHPDYHLRLGSEYRWELANKLIKILTD